MDVPPAFSRPLPRQGWLLTSAAMVACGALAYARPGLLSQLLLPLLLTGMALAATHRFGPRMGPVIAAAGTVAELGLHLPLLAAAGFGIGLAVSAALAAWLLERGDFDPRFLRGRDVAWFLLAAALGALLAPTLELAALAGADPRAPAMRAFDWFLAWCNGAVGAWLLSPLLIAVHRRSFAPLIANRSQSAVWLFGIAVCAGTILLAYPKQLDRPLILVFSVFLIVVGTVRFGLVIAALACLGLSLLVASSLISPHDELLRFTDLEVRVMMWSYCAGMSGLTLATTVLLAKRDAAGVEKSRAERRYAQIFDGSPQPIWVHDPRTLRFLMVNEAALRQYGFSREAMLSMSVTELTPPGESQAPIDGDAEDIPFETRHRTHSGQVLEVEVWTRAIEFDGERAQLVFALDVTDRRAFGRALIEAVAGEQRRIGQEMHDGLGQELTGLSLTARALANRAEREHDAIAEDLNQLALLATNCIQDARLIVQGLSPLTSVDGNLEAALEQLAQRSSLSGTPVRFHIEREAPLTLELKACNHLYRIAQEAVQNALKHAQARSIDIALRVSVSSVRLEILDDGRGLPEKELRSSGLGMRTMRFRASAIGAKLTVTQRAGGGNSVLCDAPHARVRAVPTRAAI